MSQYYVGEYGSQYPKRPMGSVVPTNPYACSTTHVVVAWILAALSAFYLLPWAIAATRGHKDVLPITMVNLFLGWTGIGWILCLVWACITPAAQQAEQARLVQSGYPYGYPTVIPGTVTSVEPAYSAAADPLSAYDSVRQPTPYSTDLYGNRSTDPFPVGTPVASASTDGDQNWPTAPWDRR